MTLKLAGRHQRRSRPASVEDRKSNGLPAKKSQHYYRRELSIFHAGGLTSLPDTETAIAQEAAIASRLCGVLVTRHSHDQYTVEVTPDVSYGVITEKDLAPFAINWNHP